MPPFTLIPLTVVEMDCHNIMISSYHRTAAVNHIIDEVIWLQKRGRRHIFIRYWLRLGQSNVKVGSMFFVAINIFRNILLYISSGKVFTKFFVVVGLEILWDNGCCLFWRCNCGSAVFENSQSWTQDRSGDRELTRSNHLKKNYNGSIF